MQNEKNDISSIDQFGKCLYSDKQFDELRKHIELEIIQLNQF